MSVGRSNAQSGQAAPVARDYVWVNVLHESPWPKSYNFQMFAVGGKLWIFHPDGNWFSSDGKTWTKSALPNAINNLAFLDYVHFKNAVYGLGYFSGNIDQFTFRPEIYRTSDLKRWETLSKSSNLPKRFFYRPFVFKDKIWIIGGEDKTAKYDDIWNSSDGVNWTKQKSGLPFGARSNSQIVELSGSCSCSIMMFGPRRMGLIGILSPARLSVAKKYLAMPRSFSIRKSGCSAATEMVSSQVRCL